MPSLSVDTSCLFSMVLNDKILGIEKRDGICSRTFAVEEFLDFLYIHQFFLLNISHLHK